jgi:hypothetical protein
MRVSKPAPLTFVSANENPVSVRNRCICPDVALALEVVLNLRIRLVAQRMQLQLVFACEISKVLLSDWSQNMSCDRFLLDALAERPYSNELHG